MRIEELLNIDGCCGAHYVCCAEGGCYFHKCRRRPPHKIHPLDKSLYGALG